MQQTGCIKDPSRGFATPSLVTVSGPGYLLPLVPAVLFGRLLAVVAKGNRVACRSSFDRGGGRRTVLLLARLPLWLFRKEAPHRWTLSLSGEPTKRFVTAAQRTTGGKKMKDASLRVLHRTRFFFSFLFLRVIPQPISIRGVAATANHRRQWVTRREPFSRRFRTGQHGKQSSALYFLK